MKSEIVTVYGIKNCDTVKKALRWLESKKIDYTFHDYKSKGIGADKLKDWINQVGWESLVNKKGLTWKQLPADVQNTITKPVAAIKLMQEKTSVIKRPLIESEGKVLTLGFDENSYKSLFS